MWIINYICVVQLTCATGIKVCTHLEILDVLIENDAELSKCDNHNAYPIHYAAQMNGRDNGHSDVKIGEKVLKKLLDSSIPFDVLDKDRRQPLLWAASAGNSDSCKLLANAGADVNSIDKDGLTALHCAASRGHSDCVDRLKKLGAEVNVADTNGCTALFYAITLGNKECTRLLLKYGADPNHKDSRGRTPTHCAAIKGCLETVKMLDKSKAELWFASFRGDCPIHEAAQGGHCDVVKYLLKAKNTPEAVNTANDAGRTCLHISAIVNNLQLCKLLLDNNADKNSIMKNKDKAYTPYDAAIIKGNNEIAEYIRSKGGVTGGDIDNILQAKGKKRDAKSAKSRKSVQTLESTPEEAEPEDNKKVDEKTKVEPVEDDNKKKDKGKKKEKEEKEREKEKLVIVPKDKQKKKDQEEKGKEDQKESEKEKADEDQEGKGEKKELTDKELKELQDRIKAGEGAVDERDIKRKAIKDLGEKQKLDDVVEEDQEEKEKEEDLTEEEQKDLEAKIKAGQSDLDERDKKQKEGKETEDQKKKDKNKTDKKEGEKDIKGKKKDLSDKEQKAGQKKVKSGDKTERDKKQKKTEEEKKEKGGKPDLTDTEVAAITAAVVIATDKDKKDQDQKTKDKKDQDLKTKDKKDQDLKTKDKKDKDQFEGLDIPPSSPDLRDPKQKTKDEKEQDQKTKDGIDQDQTSKDKKDQDQKTKDKKDQDKKIKDKKDQDLKTKDKKDQDQKTKDKKDQFEGLAIPPSSPDLRDPKQKTKDKKEQDQKTKDGIDQDQTSKDKKDQDQKIKDKKDQDQFEGLAIPPSSPDLRDPKQKTKDKKDQDQKSKDKKDQDQKIKDKKDQDQKIKDKKGQDQTTKRQEDQFEGADIPPSSPGLSDPEQKRKEKDKDDQASGEDTSDRDQDQESSEERADELDSEETRKKRGSGKQDSKEKREVHVQIPAGAFERSPVATASNRSRRDSPVKYRDSRSRSKSSDAEEFEFPEGAHENTEAAIAAAEARRKARERSRSRSTDRASVERQTELRKYSKVNTDGRIQPGLLAENYGRNRRFDERDTPSPLDSEDEFIDDPYFGRRIKTYGGGLRLGNKRIDNREKILREKSELKRKRQLEKMSRSSQRLPTRGGVSRMLPLGYSRLETPQRPITRKSNSIQESVRRYQTERTFVRQLHQLKRAQIYTGPMHDIVLFSKLMDVYKNSSANDSELDIDSQALDDWDGYLQDQLRFVSHYYEDDRTGLRDIKGDAKEYHHQLEKSATDAKKTVESRIDHIIKQNEKDETAEREEREKLDKKISNIAEKTGHMLDNVRQQANESVAGARDLNSSLEEEMRRERQDRLKHSKYSSRNEKAWLLEQEAIDNRHSRMDEQDKERKEKHKEWMRKKDEEMRRKLLRVYGPTPVVDPFVSKRTSPKASTPKPNLNFNSRSSSRPKSMMSSISGSRSRPQDQELEVHMTEFGMRRVKRDEFSFAKMSTPQSQSYVRPAAILPANWTPKYDGINLRPRAGLVFVEPTIYDEVLKEEQMIRTGQTRNSMRNLTLETDNNMLETVDL